MHEHLCVVVYPSDVTDALLTPPAVTAAEVIGRPDGPYGEQVVAYVTIEGDAALASPELLRWCSTRLGRHKQPRELHVVDAVPLTSVGKSDRKAFRRRGAEAGSGGAGGAVPG